MATNRNMTTRWLVMGLLISLVGCQTSQPMKPGTMDNTGFMDLWKTYSHCQAGSDVEGLRNDAFTLASAANRALAQETFVLPLPKKLEQFVSRPTSRFAVDVKAMAAACSIRAGQVAVDAGKFDLAKDLLKTVLAHSQSEDYRYYSSQAETLLAELEARFVQVSLRVP
ncbi:MAG: hypothetical protein MN733_15355 [Nitrososphaera sp.]|nr:hypothetical protein [Nitrososphaera sp.]